MVPADTYLDFISERDKIRETLLADDGRLATTVPGSAGQVVVASADVHEYALNLLVDALSHLGVEVTNAGASVDPDELAQAATDARADLLLVSTHNGMALTYAEQLLAELRHRNAAPVVAMGGVLKQDDGVSEEPVDVRPALEALGVRICTSIEEIMPLLCAAKDSASHA